MENLTTYRASDRRVYNGSSCSDMQREQTHTKDLLARMNQAEPAARCTYFPMEGQYLVFVNLKQLTGKFHDDKQLALIEAITVLESKGD